MLLTNLLAQLALGLVAMTICLPSMQEWGDMFGASQAQVQLTFSAFVVAYGVCQLVHGALSDRYGRKGVLVTGLALLAAGSWCRQAWRARWVWCQALAGSAAALAGLSQQLMGALGGYSVGLVSHHGSRNLGLLMLGLTLCALAAHLALRRQVVRISPASRADGVSARAPRD